MNIKKFFSFDWLNSDERKELEQLRREKIEQEIRNKIDKENVEKVLSLQKSYISSLENLKPYSSLYFTGKDITVIFPDGESLTMECDVEKYKNVKDCKTKEEIIEILYPSVKNDVEIAKKDLAILEINDDFEVKDTDVYLKPCRIPLPEIVKAAFIKVLEQKLAASSSFKGSDYDIDKKEEEYQALKMFWYKLSINPMEESREQLLKILKKYNVSLTRNGNFLGYRRILSKHAKNKDLVEFVSKEYFKIKQWKKSPSNYEVFNDNGYVLVEHNKQNHGYNNRIGNLKELYLDLPNLQEMTYTDDYTQTYDIRIGDVYKIKEEDIDLNKNGSCGGSLHVSLGRGYYNYDSFGDTDVLVVVNPTHFYKTDTGCTGKFGVKQMFIACAVEIDEEGNYVNVNQGDINNFDEEYHNISIQELQEVVKTKNLEQISVQDYTPNASIDDIKRIAEILKNKTVLV